MASMEKQKDHKKPAKASSDSEEPTVTACEEGHAAAPPLDGLSSIAMAPLAAASRIDRSGPLEGQMVEIRKRNALYSKKKYYKKKEEIQRLESVKLELATSNEQVRNDNARLETMLREAQRKVGLIESMGREEPMIPWQEAQSQTLPSAFSAAAVLPSPQAGLSGIAAASSLGLNSTRNPLIDGHQNQFDRSTASLYPAISLIPQSEQLGLASPVSFQSFPTPQPTVDNFLLLRALNSQQPLGQVLHNNAFPTGVEALWAGPMNAAPTAQSLMTNHNLLPSNQQQQMLHFLAQNQQQEQANALNQATMHPLDRSLHIQPSLQSLIAEQFMLQQGLLPQQGSQGSFASTFPGSLVGLQSNNLAVELLREQFQQQQAAQASSARVDHALQNVMHSLLQQQQSAQEVAPASASSGVPSVDAQSEQNDSMLQHLLDRQREQQGSESDSVADDSSRKRKAR